MSKQDIYEHARSLEKMKDEDLAIKITNLTKDYGKGRGIFDVNLKIPKGKTFGYCGTNGAGKTTTFRHIMGFLKPQSGEVKVFGHDAWEESELIKKYIGYLPGEIAFPDVSSGSEFLKIQASMTGLTDMSKAERIINALQLDPTANLKRMSKGMKQKTALVVAFMSSQDIILLDEPTTGLDPLMREAFVNIVKEEKARGATVIMSNHMFDELEECCDYVAFIKEGEILDIVDMEELHNHLTKQYKVFFNEKDAYKKFIKEKIKIIDKDDTKLIVSIEIQRNLTNEFLKLLNKYSKNLINVQEIIYDLEKFFMTQVIGGK